MTHFGMSLRAVIAFQARKPRPRRILRRALLVQTFRFATCYGTGCGFEVPRIRTAIRDICSKSG